MKYGDIVRVRDSWDTATAEERTELAACFRAVRSITPMTFTMAKIRTDWTSRYRNLAIAFLGGVKYRRVERKTRTQDISGEMEYRYIGSPIHGPPTPQPAGTIIVHNRPNEVILLRVLQAAIPDFASYPSKELVPDIDDRLFDEKVALAMIFDWLKNESGAVPMPPRTPKTKREYLGGSLDSDNEIRQMRALSKKALTDAVAPIRRVT